MTKKSMRRLVRDAWKREDVEKLVELAELTPEEEKEIRDKMKDYDLKWLRVVLNTMKWRFVRLWPIVDDCSTIVKLVENSGLDGNNSKLL